MGSIYYRRLGNRHTNIELLSLVMSLVLTESFFGMDGERQSSHGGRTGPHDYNLSRMSYRESSCAYLKEWNQLPTNMAVFLMAFLPHACGHGAACCAALTVDAQILNMISNIELMIVVLILNMISNIELVIVVLILMCGHSQRHAGERTSCPSHTRQS